MINKVIRKYKENRVKIINKFSYSEIDLADEIIAIDDGYISYKFNEFKKAYNQIVLDIENLVKYGEKNQYNHSKINTLIEEKNEMEINIAYLISNVYNNISLSESLLSKIDTDFNIAILGINYYFKGDYHKARVNFEKYFSTLDSIPNHYLINKCYGNILIFNNEYKLALPIMRRALELKPDDINLHISLREIYNEIGDINGYNVEKNILELLTVN